MATTTRLSRTFTVSFPPDLAEQVERLAARESRTTSELFREAFRAYRAARIRAMLDNLHAQTKAESDAYSDDDIERFVDEDRTERWYSRKAATTGNIGR
ncbi:MAG TPA: ribbon-helix-helix protein, CopG family [Acidobacteriaceae bacterium]